MPLPRKVDVQEAPSSRTGGIEGKSMQGKGTEGQSMGGRSMGGGNINWLENYDSGVRRASDSNKPLLLVFKGKSGIESNKKFEEQVLGNNDIINSINECFIPVWIDMSSSRGSGMRDLLDKFNESGSDNYVVRFIKPQTEEDLASRLESDYTAKNFAVRLVQALNSFDKSVPSRLQQLARS
eukprot:m.11696 g.11696  ORF g.11696 m.11696 type:complete len:181 (+) comp6629_c0_seq1:414-956(+)